MLDAKPDDPDGKRKRINSCTLSSDFHTCRGMCSHIRTHKIKCNKELFEEKKEDQKSKVIFGYINMRLCLKSGKVISGALCPQYPVATVEYNHLFYFLKRSLEGFQFWSWGTSVQTPVLLRVRSRQGSGYLRGVALQK